MKTIKATNIVILALFLVISFLFWNEFRSQLGVSNDTLSYVIPANNLLTTYTFTDESGVPETSRTIGYPLFLAVIFALGGGYDTVIVCQIILSAFCLFLIYRMCLKFGNKRCIPSICCSVYLLDYTIYIYQTCILSDIFFYDMLVFSLFFLVQYYIKRSMSSFILFSIFLNFALEVRPILMYYNSLLAVSLIVMVILKKIEWHKCICYCIIFILFFFAWCFRNYEATGVFQFSSIRNYNLMMYDASVLRSKIENVTIEEARAKFLNELTNEYGEEIKVLNNPQLLRYYGIQGSNYIKANILMYMIQNVTGVLNEMFGPNKSFLQSVIHNKIIRYGIIVLYIAYLCSIYILYTIGFIRNIGRLNIVDWFIFTISGYCVAAGASLGYARFRVAWFGLIIVGAFLLLTKNEEYRRTRNFR